MSFSAEDCEIYLKPSTELIPDEYLQSDNKNACVHIFVFIEDVEKHFVDCMKLLGYSITERNVHPLSTRVEVMSSLQSICHQTKDKSSLIILFWGLFRADRKFLLKDGSSIKLIDIWSKFITYNCPMLKGKPKIFIFNGVKHLENTQEDAFSLHRRSSENFTYNIPAEADILIVFKQNDDLKTSDEYMDSLCSNFTNYAQREDISSLLTIAHFSSHPILISTMTRKFYLKPNPNRGIQLSIREKYNKIQQSIQKVKENIISLTKEQKKIREYPEKIVEVQESTTDLKRACSTEENLHRRISKPDVGLKFRPRSNTASKLIDIDKLSRKKKADNRPAWRF